MKIGKAKIKSFRNKIHRLVEQELELRTQAKLLYAQLMAESGDEKMALRHVRQAYFQIQKYRITKLLEDRLEFHPFFTASPFKASDLFEEDSEDDDTI